jgi:signal transduction histidine kinase
MAEAVRRLPGPARELLRLAVVALAYYIAARASLQLALVHGQVTPVWPPTGIALVAILILGYRVWPAITIAAFAINLPLGPNALGAAVIAGGNTLAPLTAAFLMKRAGFRLELDRLRDAASVIVLGALVGMSVSATIGSLVLIVSGSVPPDAFAPTWAVWWTGDAMGVLLVAPFLLSFWPRVAGPELTPRRAVELLALLLAVGVVTYIVFANRSRLEYIVFPLIMLAAFRFRLRGAAPAALIASGVAVAAAVTGSGPFAAENLFQKMVTLQVFNVFVALSSFVLASYVDTRERKEQLTRLYVAAQMSNEVKGEFLRLAAHELRGPLTVIAGYLTMLDEGALGTPPRRWKEPLATLNVKTAELKRIMDDLLEVSRFEADRGAPARGHIDLRVLVREAVERARPRLALKHGRIELEPGPLAIGVLGNDSQLSRIVDNLLNNAMSYTATEPSLTVRLGVEGDRATLRVIDNGIGIDERDRERIFEPFRRGNDPAIEKIPGTGLGLYIARKLAEENGGTLTIESTSTGKGSTFLLSLPAATASVQPSAAPASGASVNRLGVQSG